MENGGPPRPILTTALENAKCKASHVFTDQILLEALHNGCLAAGFVEAAARITQDTG